MYNSRAWWWPLIRELGRPTKVVYGQEAEFFLVNGQERLFGQHCLVVFLFVCSCREFKDTRDISLFCSPTRWLVMSLYTFIFVFFLKLNCTHETTTSSGLQVSFLIVLISSFSSSTTFYIIVATSLFLISVNNSIYDFALPKNNKTQCQNSLYSIWIKNYICSQSSFISLEKKMFKIMSNF